MTTYKTRSYFHVNTYRMPAKTKKIEIVPKLGAFLCNKVVIEVQ